MSRAPFKFDLSVFDIFNTFKAGATLLCFDWNKKREDQNKHVDYVALMGREKATILYTTPSTFITLMNRGGLSDSDLCLREVMYAGEPFPTPQLRNLQKALPGARIANIYGPTETNIITYYWVDKIPENDEPIPLGNVVEDTEILVVSEDSKRICEPGESGELWCRGGTVTLGYLGMEDSTKEHLVLSPFHKYPAVFWRTGDFGHRDTDGCLHYRGRKDHMIKVKGFRIEIGEVESAISATDGIDEFVVVAIPDDKYGNRLYCFYSVLDKVVLTEKSLTEFLKTKLPDYMIPYKFFLKDTLPKTSSGKVDRVLLADQIKDHG
ncbi:MAG TPA: AMP-binding protein [Candidatus Paceibacterota bacterium]